jgi:hypothetical protein
MAEPNREKDLRERLLLKLMSSEMDRVSEILHLPRILMDEPTRK